MLDRPRRRREENAERRPSAGGRANFDTPFVRPHDPVHGGEAETAPREFRREERVEDLRRRRLVHPAPRVADLERHVAPGLHVARDRRGSRGVDLLDGRRHVDRPPFFSDRFGAVDDEVHHDLLDLRRIGEDGRQIRSDVEEQLHLRR